MRPPNILTDGYPSRTLTYTCTDLPQSIAEDELFFEGKPALTMFISCEMANARITFGDSDPDSTLHIGHALYSYNTEWIRSSKAIRTFQFCNALAGQQTDALIHITLFFDRQ